ncbi:MAG: hypothetical protein A2W05_00045 [Candidatus Schekmanbacteria bacterium RBG_16_38_10]|uniref:Uncharacterized protein n=1 Tax=Candidatus Schekmanbacteria bacterium RBG_16_38_10 TaxID=1817879 RepID=A0A1F7S350_9BACT|nr:MAG: hypothetical protein A2W05_00045 [Candidatus Schekmanbacteria bacterium RBG_16_38_10]
MDTKVKNNIKSKAIIIHSVDDAKHCVQNKLYEGALLFSTHASVDVYLKGIHGINCQSLSKYLTIEEIKNLKNISSDAVDKILHALDINVSPSINNQLCLKMRYFVPLYSYCGKYHYSGYLNFFEAVKKVTNIYKLGEISFYNCKLNSYFDTDSDIGYAVSLFFRDQETKIIEYPRISENRNDNIEMMLKKIKIIKQMPIYAIERFLERMLANRKYRKLAKGCKNILLFDPLYNLEFLKKELRKYNILFYRTDSGIPEGFNSKEKTANTKVNFNGFDFVKDIENPITKIFLNDIEKDFSKNIGKYLAAIDALGKIERDYPIALGIWGNPPYEKTKALIFEYLKLKNINILGAQHGCLYGECFEPWHFDSDFNRCDVYVSYGFTESDLKRLYPYREVAIKIFPLGAVNNSPKNSRRKKRIDILFPITNSFSFFNGGMARTPLDKLAERQVLLLEYLNSLEGLKIYIKPFNYSYTKKYSVLSVLRKMENLKVVDHLSLGKFIEFYSPRAILIENPSQPLFDVLHLDTEIFLMSDPLLPYDGQALKELEMRVHYAEDTANVICKLNLFLKGKLEKKRDDTFYRHYVYKENAKENILRLVDNLVEGHI